MCALGGCQTPKHLAPNAAIRRCRLAAGGDTFCRSARAVELPANPLGGSCVLTYIKRPGPHARRCHDPARRLAHRPLRPLQAHGAARRHPGAGAHAADAEGARRGGGARHRRLRHRLPRLAARRRRPRDVEGEAALEAADIKFEPGLNEDLAATALWGTQQAELRGEGRVQGVFGLWYGKGPGVDRCGDVFRHANMAGTSSSAASSPASATTTPARARPLHHSEFALVDAMMPILSPAGVQEVLDYGLLGWALSRYTGCWVGLKCVKDTIEVDRGRRRRPAPADDRRARDFAMPPGGLNIRLTTPRSPRRRGCTTTSASPPRPSPAPTGSTAASGAAQGQIGIVSCGKSWLDTARRSTCSASTPPRPSGSASPLQGRHGLAARHGELPRVGARPRAHHRRRGEAQARRGADQGGDLRRPPRPPRRLEGRAGRGCLPGQAGARPGEDRPHPRPLALERASRPSARRAAAASLEAACAPTTPRRSPSASPGSARAARTTPRRGCPRAPAPMPASAATTWCSGWTATPRASPTWAARARTGSARRRSRRAPRLPEPRRRHLQPFRLSLAIRAALAAASTSPTRSSTTTPSR